MSTETKIAHVDLNIAGTPHRISCPVNEIDNLKKTTDLLNKNLRQLRIDIAGANPSNEELLVLHCLDLYDQIRELQEAKKDLTEQEYHATVLINKLLKTAAHIAG